ncbi:MAG: lipocalin-like domain-containing protein [Bacteroidaceae bacterium]|nr:lipocalin-like domain-containing protein [Bacteroidaceae bacterium]
MPKHLLLYSLTALLLSCKIEGSPNKNLDGAWRLTAINDSTPSSVIAGGVSADRNFLYWNIQGKMLELIDRNNSKIGRFLLRFKHEEDVLYLYDPYIYNREEGDKPLQDSTRLTPYGIDDIDEPFIIEKLNGSVMTLRSSTKKLDFRNF